MFVCYHQLLLFDEIHVSKQETPDETLRRSVYGVSSGATLFADVPHLNKQLTVMCTTLNQYPVSKPMNGKQAGHFMQNGAIYKAFQEL